MRFMQSDLPGVIIVEPDVHRDNRGFFLESYHAEKYRACGIPGTFVQDNHSCSVRNTVRGLHLQRRNPQGKLIRVIHGEVWDVAVDLRPGSSYWGKWTAVVLSADNFRQLYIPPGFAHGFCVLSDIAHLEYKCSELYDPSDEVGVAHDDPQLAIAWPVAEPLLSERDKRNPTLAAFVLAHSLKATGT
jgi:dTDP-4-dehydrorhamnose 3,5-epimerase